MKNKFKSSKLYLKLKKLKNTQRWNKNNHIFKFVDVWIIYGSWKSEIIEIDAGSYKILVLVTTIEAYNLWNNLSFQV